jgi:hypothetical protein
MYSQGGVAPESISIAPDASRICWIDQQQIRCGSPLGGDFDALATGSTPISTGISSSAGMKYVLWTTPGISNGGLWRAPAALSDAAAPVELFNTIEAPSRLFVTGNSALVAHGTGSTNGLYWFRWDVGPPVDSMHWATDAPVLDVVARTPIFFIKVDDPAIYQVVL